MAARRPLAIEAVSAAAALVALLGGCAATPDATNGVTASLPPPMPASPSPPAAPPSQGGTVASPGPDTEAASGTAGEAERLDDPSAPLDTPLCGRAAREVDADGAAIAPDVMQGGGACVQTACFDPLTITYIGADGYRHVCQ